MVRMQGEDAVHGALDDGVDLVLIGRRQTSCAKLPAWRGALRGCMKEAGRWSTCNMAARVGIGGEQTEGHRSRDAPRC